MIKKMYICPLMDVTDLRTIRATMQAFNSASMPSDSFNGNGAPRRRNDNAPVF